MVLLVLSTFLKRDITGDVARKGASWFTKPYQLLMSVFVGLCEVYLGASLGGGKGVASYLIDP